MVRQDYERITPEQVREATRIVRLFFTGKDPETENTQTDPEKPQEQSHD